MGEESTTNASSVGKSFTLRESRKSGKYALSSTRERTHLDHITTSACPVIDSTLYEGERQAFYTIPAKPHQPMRAPWQEIQLPISFEVGHCQSNLAENGP